MSSDSDAPENCDDELAFAKNWRKYPIVHSKSTFSKDIRKKREAWKALGEVFKLPPDKIKKKMQNMVKETRKAFSKSATGNKPIKAKEWEKEIKNQLDASETNPVFHGVPGGVCSTSDPKTKISTLSSVKRNTRLYSCAVVPDVLSR